MTFRKSEKDIKEKLREFEKADLEEYCKKNGIKDSQREKFIENSMNSIVSTENGDTE